jgi:hypothetical protein
MLAALVLENPDNDILAIVGIAAVAGLVGGIIGELIALRGRSKDWGGFEVPHRGGKHWYDVGSFASLPVGAVAGILAALLLAPSTDHVANGKTTSTIASGTLIATALLGGLGGAAFLRGLETRFMSAANTAHLRGMVKGVAAVVAPTDPPSPKPASSDVVNEIMAANSDAAAQEVASKIATQATLVASTRAESTHRALLAALSEPYIGEDE